MNIFHQSAFAVCPPGACEQHIWVRASGGFPHVCHVSLSCGHYQAAHSTCVQNWLKKDPYVEQQIRHFRTEDLMSVLLLICELCLATFHISMVS